MRLPRDAASRSLRVDATAMPGPTLASVSAHAPFHSCCSCRGRWAWYVRPNTCVCTSRGARRHGAGSTDPHSEAIEADCAGPIHRYRGAYSHVPRSLHEPYCCYEQEIDETP